MFNNEKQWDIIWLLKKFQAKLMLNQQSLQTEEKEKSNKKHKTMVYTVRSQQLAKTRDLKKV